MLYPGKTHRFWVVLTDGPAMIFNELVRLLEAHGWREARKGKGSARLFRHPDSPEPLVLHLHPSKEVRKGTLAAILKQAGIPRR